MTASGLQHRSAPRGIPACPPVLQSLGGITMTAQAAPAGTRQQAAYPWLTRYPEGVDWHQNITPAPLYQLLDEAAAKYGSRTCTNFLGRVVTYRDMVRMVDRAAAGLQRL